MSGSKVNVIAIEKYFRSCIRCDIQEMNRDISSVRSNLKKATSTINYHNAIMDPGISVLYLKLKEKYDPPLGKLGLEALTKCPITMYAQVGQSSL